MTDVPPLLRPLDLGGRRVPNRLVFGPHETNLARRRDISRRHLAYYTRRARGGAGLIVTESASVHPWDWPYERAPLAADCGPGWRAVATACHEEGALVLAGLTHAGSQGSSAYSQRELWAPSSVPDVASREVPKEMELGDVTAVVTGFASAAALALDSGLDGVEINAGQHSLLRQFLSGLTNLRTDAYGRDKARLVLEVLAAVRAAVPDAIVGLRLSCDELAPWAGITPEAAASLAVEFAPHVDYVGVIRGSAMAASATRPDGHTPAGFNLELAGAIRSALRSAGRAVAVLAQGSIVDVDQATAAVDDAADLVEMTRALLADANLPRKVAQGQADRVRPCILCNQSCMVRDPRNPIVSCVADPRTGHEWDQPTIMDIPPVSRRVAVVGGGPAGLEAARVARTRGHSVRLFEASATLGGAFAVAAAGAGRERLARLSDWLVAECHHLGVQVELGTTADADLVRGLGTDVILTTGSLDGLRTFAVAESAAGSVRTARAVLEVLQTEAFDTLPTGAAVVWDPIGGPIGISVAETLAGIGREVALVTPDPIAGNELSRSGDLAPANSRLLVAGVTIARHCTLRRVDAGHVTVENRLTAEVRQLPAGLVVDAGFRRPDERLWHALDEDTLRAGDEVAPRTVYEALLEARRAVMELDSRPLPRPRPRVAASGSAGLAVPVRRSAALEGVGR